MAVETPTEIQKVNLLRLVESKLVQRTTSKEELIKKVTKFGCVFNVGREQYFPMNMFVLLD